jgi:Ras-related protein Rab-4B
MAKPSSSDSVDFTFKCIIIGDSFAGKSSLLQQFVNGKVNQTAKQTVGVEYGSRTCAISSESAPTGTHIAKLQIWDTAGQDKFRSVTRSYYRGSVGCLCVFSLTDRASFEHLEQWLHDARSQASEGVCIVIVGNKLDAASPAPSAGEADDGRRVSLIEASQFALAHGCPYVEVSARTGEGVDGAFYKMVRACSCSAAAVALPVPPLLRRLLLLLLPRPPCRRA